MAIYKSEKISLAKLKVYYFSFFIYCICLRNEKSTTKYLSSNNIIQLEHNKPSFPQKYTFRFYLNNRPNQET